MAFDKTQFAALVERTLMLVDLPSPSAVCLLLGTAAVESDFGTFLAQKNGPALGVYQMEPATESDIWENYLRYRIHLADMLLELCGRTGPSRLALEGDIVYQTIMARIHYLRVMELLPEPDDIPGLARYWKRYWNTPDGKGTEARFLITYARYVYTGHDHA